MEDYDPTSNINSEGYYSDTTNRLVVINKNLELNLEFIIHELAHKVMAVLFNNISEPYNNHSLKNKYHQAIKNTLINIQTFLKKDFALEVKFKDQNNTWQMGKTLSKALFFQYLNLHETEEQL